MNTPVPPTVPLASVASGARLALDVPGDDGQILLAAGTTLTDGVLKGLAAHGITRVALQPAQDEAELDAAREAMRRRLAHLFRRCDLDEVDGAARQIHDAMLSHRLEMPR